MKKTMYTIVDKKEKKKTKDTIHKFYGHLTLVAIICSILITFILYLCAQTYRENIISLFEFFEKSDFIQEYFVATFESFSIINIVPLMITIFIYFYFFEHIKKTRIYSLLDYQKESKYFQFLFSFFGFFNYILVIPLSLYLFFIKQAFLETFTLLIFWITTKYLFFDLLTTYKQILFDYNSLINFNINYRKYEDSNFRKVCLELSNKYKVNFELKSIISENKHIIVSYITKKVILFIFTQKSLYLRTVFFISIFFAIISVTLDFNLLSIMYIQLHLLMWYFVLSIILGLPFTLSDIYLVNGINISNVYIIEDSPNGHIITLDSQNKTKKLLKSSIVLIENS
ncbi:MAG: hypothetical protein AWU59_323 [Methanolobus sp. T82-4]|jgi:hypothetical protein|nr:MAG: hypothetical protein AWU59_323 [Methanolobus sp. T82-4]